METKIEVDNDMVLVPTDDPMFPWYILFWYLADDKAAFGALARAIVKTEARMQECMDDEVQQYCFGSDPGKEAAFMIKKFAENYLAPMRVEEIDPENERFRRVVQGS